MAALLSGCAGYVPGAKAYWDAKVKEMCHKDGGVKIIKRVHLSEKDMDELRVYGGKIGIPSRRAAPPQAPIYSELTFTTIREKNPRVERAEAKVVQQADGIVVARWVAYFRSGGDFPTGFSESTSYVCPTTKVIERDLQQLFISDDS